MIADYHMHLRDEREEIAHDASSVGPFVAAARAAGVDEIGFAGHVYYFRQTRPLWTVAYHVERCNRDLDTIHFIGRDAVDSEPRLAESVGVEEAWRRYFELLARAAESGLFETIAIFERRESRQVPFDG